MKIFKYQFNNLKGANLILPTNAVLIHLAVQNGEITLWAMIDPQMPLCERKFKVFLTGAEIDEERFIYVGTVLMVEGAFVWHVFEQIGD